MEAVQLTIGQMFQFNTTKQACKIASLKIGVIIAEAPHGLEIQIGYTVHCHGKLLSAAFVQQCFMF